MGRVWNLIANLYRRWRFVEEAPATVSGGAAQRTRSPQDERVRLEQAVERDRKMVEHYRRNGCETLARDREASVRAMERRISAIKLGVSRTA
jgi:hypothetical protein